MIFVTVGHELRFDRLIEGLDDWSLATGYQDIFAQVAELGDDGYRPKNFKWQSFLDPDSFKSNFDQADLIVAHAGMGTIITALTLKKPLLIMPRKGSLKETRNDHQIATAEQFSRRTGIYVAKDETELGATLDHLIANPPPKINEAASQFAEPQLIQAIRSFIYNGKPQELT
ncbi:glucuronosyltransferase [Sneathiella chungangensis]|uniref:Glucuronosyltransferase n=1 Tax=Sneathiella chungangensis TaxID=1418234 RepID=A0A845MNN0_9PROT|nr:glycosyltransferase [Sneathiella chungangensis]MZR23974.1 glucuronosyltransferase [Sneathiella chungangensis]